MLRLLYRDLLRLRRETPALRTLDLSRLETYAEDDRGVLLIRRWTDRDQALIAFNFSDQERMVAFPFGEGAWQPLMETVGRIESGRVTLSAEAFALFGRLE